MWWSRLALAVVLAAAGPSACGFRPLYGTASSSPSDNGSPAQSLSAIYVEAIADRGGQQFRTALQQRLSPHGQAAAPRYTLLVTLSSSTEGLGYQKDAKATLGRMFITGTFVLSDESGTQILSGTSRSVVSFNYLGPRYASMVAERDAEERALSELAEDVRRQLAVYFETTGK